MDKFKCVGVVRTPGTNALEFFFNRRPSDEEMRYLHEVMERAAACSPFEAAKLTLVKP